MKKTGLLLKIFLIISVTMCYTSCTVEDCKCSPDMKTMYFKVDFEDWWWNSNFERFEYMFDVPDITNNIYNKGLVHAGVFIIEIGQGGKKYEVLKPLPFVQTYADGSYTYTETISYDISPGSILFNIQASDLYAGDEFLQTYNFKVSILY